MNPRSLDRNDDRGQLIIVAGIGLAVTLVALALILNSVIYTGNLATRDIESGANDAAKINSDVKGGVGGVMDGANDPSSATSYSGLESDFEDGTDRWRRDAAKYSTLRGHSLRIPSSGMSYYRGLRIADESSGTFEPRLGSKPDWVVAPDVRARAFTMTADGGLTSELAGTVESDLSSPSGSYFYTEIATDSGPTWRIAIYEDSGTGETAVTVYDSTALTTPVTCHAGASANAGNKVAIDVGDATVNGRPCPALRAVGDTNAPYTISYHNGASITGTWDLTVDWLVDDSVLNDESNLFTDAVDTTNYGDHCSSPTYHDPSAGATGSSPFVTPALYSGTVTATFESQSVEHTADLRIADRELSQGTTVPRFTSVTITDQSTAAVDAKFEIDADVADPNGDLTEVQVTLVEIGGGGLSTTETQTVSGSTDSATISVDSAISLGATVDIIVTVVDTAGTSNARSTKQRHEADGDDSPGGTCVP